jgi:hypothetical protein
MNRLALLSATSALVAVSAYAAVPAKTASSAPPPIATYWMDVSTTSGLGAGMMGGRRPNIGAMMAMMRGGSSVGHTLALTLASRDTAAAPTADHLIPPALQMGPSLPLLAPQQVRAEPDTSTPGMPPQFQRPKGRMLIYWGCREHAGPGQPTVIDFAKLAAGQVPTAMAQFATMARTVQHPHSAPGFGEWPNRQDSRAVPVAGSLVGAHRIEANYAPPMAFNLSAGQDFMAGLGLHEAGMSPAGADRLAWQPVAQATGYALAMFGAGQSGDVIMWSSGKGMPALDYLTPSEVRRLIAAGQVLPPSTSQCLLPAEVAAASPAGMVTMIGYGPVADFSDSPRAPKWVAKVRYKTTASLIRGMPGIGAGMPPETGQAGQPPQQPPPKRRRGLGGLLGGIVPIPH